ncbi:MAG: omega-amidase [Chitinophagales bacterium]|jgi:omega-amidase
MTKLTVSLAQLNLQWENPNKNLVQITSLLDSQLATATATDLIILPEMFTSGFTMDNVKIAEAMDGISVKWLKDTAKKYNCAITGSIPITEKGSIYNRLIFATPNSLEYYDKKHLFSMAGEHERYQAGDKLKIINWRGWRINLQVCYDLRFPVWSRNQQNYDLLLYVANWPARRRMHWRNLLIARAIENQCHVIGVNRVGIDGKDISYSGDSLLLDHLGELVQDCSDRAGLYTQIIDLDKQNTYQEKFPAYRDADKFSLDNS